MRLGISLLNLQPGAAGGIETYMRKLIEHAPAMAGNDEVIFFVHRDHRDLVPDSLHPVVLDRSQLSVSLCRILEAFTPWRDRRAEWLLRSTGVDVMLYPQQSMYPHRNRTPTVLLVADVQYVFHPERYSWLDRRFRKHAYLTGIRDCSVVSSISGVTADHLLQLELAPRNKIEVIHLGYDPPQSRPATAATPHPPPYLYYPAATFPHKGHAQLIETFAALRRSGDIDQTLVFTGMRTHYWKALQKQIHASGMRDCIVHLGYVSYDEVQDLYAGADAALFPSEFEGFGIPVLEATQHGKRIICSRLEIFDELGVPSEWQIDFSQPRELLHALQQSGPTRLAKEIHSWAEVCAQTLDLLRETAESRHTVSS